MSLMESYLRISKQKIHVLLHSSHSMRDKLKFPEVRHDTAQRIHQVECELCSALLCSQAAAWQPHLQETVLLVRME